MALLDLAIEVKTGKKKMSDMPASLRPAIARAVATLDPEQLTALQRKTPPPREFTGTRTHVRSWRMS